MPDSCLEDIRLTNTSNTCGSVEPDSARQSGITEQLQSNRRRTQKMSDTANDAGHNRYGKDDRV